ncbi:MAG: hypothetical protein ABJF01_17560 [bacterium]
MIPTVDMIDSSLDAIEQAGGDVSQPTQILDQNGYTVAVVSVVNGQKHVMVPDSPSYSVSGVLQTVTGFIDSVAGTLTNLNAQIQRGANAVRGAAAGAQAGYNAPLTFTPYLLGAGAVLVLVLLTSRRRR